jgi:hypothetical protein
MRERDIRNAIQAALLATNEFDAVEVWGKPEDYGVGASLFKLAIIEPGGSAQTDLWDAPPDAGIVIASRIRITLYARAEDPQLRDEMAEQLVSVVANAINFQQLVQYNMPALSRVKSWEWMPPAPPERQIVITYECQYIVDPATSCDTAP